jgi:hypothetical protein
MMIERDAVGRVRELMGWFPVVVVTGPRHIGQDHADTVHVP